MAKMIICPICKRERSATKHHIYRSAVWKNVPWTRNEVILICRECHNFVEQEITKRENKILQHHPYLYREVIRDFTNGTIRVAWRKRYRKGK